MWIVDRAASSSGARQARQYRKAGAALEKLLARATIANGKGTLGVSLVPLDDAVTALLGLLPSG